MVNSIGNELAKFISSVEFYYSTSFCLAKITSTCLQYSKESIEGGLLETISNSLNKVISNEKIVENITIVYMNLIVNNIENIIRLCKVNSILTILIILEHYINTIYNQIVINCIVILDQIAMIDEGIIYLSSTKFPSLLTQTFHLKMNEVDIIKISLHCLGNFVYKDLGLNIISIEFENTLNLLIKLQKKYYSNSDVLISINLVAGYLIKIMKEKSAKEKLYFLISESIKIQDFMISLIIMTLILVYEILILFPYLIDDVFDMTMHSLFNLLRNHTNSEIVNICYKILVLFSKNFIYSYTMVNNGLVELIKNTLDSELDVKVKFSLREMLFHFLGILSIDTGNSVKISEIIMSKIVADVLKEDYANNQSDMIVYFSFNTRNCCLI